VASFPAYADDNFPVTRVRKVRRLPLPGEVLVEQGQAVRPDQPVAKISLRPGIPWVVPVARLLGIEPADLPGAMLRKVGDKVRNREVIAKAVKGLYGQKEYEAPTDGVIEEISDKSGRIIIREEFGKEEPPVSFDAAFELGVRPRELPKMMLVRVGQEVKRGAIIAKKGETAAFFTKTARAPISGVVAAVNDQTGYVTIARPFKEVVVRGYLAGRVAEVLPGRGCVVEADAVRLTGAFGLGRETFGPLRVLVDKPSDVLTADAIDASCAGQIIVGGSQATNEAMAKALEVGVRGVITGTAHYLNLVKSLNVRLGVGITGQEDIDMTVILMEGFGMLAMREQAFAALKKLEGREASINGATQIRAGAIRPEIIVPMGTDGHLNGAAAQVDEDLTVGQRVRIVNDPYFGRIGTIAALPRESRAIETGAVVPVAEVELPDGSVVVVPRKNVEIL
jgi:hypothetical protein